MQMEHLTINVDGKSVRRETMDGRAYLVAPLVMMTEGVHEGSRGPLLYRSEELSRWAPSWNHKPITLNHPEKDGKPISGSDPEVLNTLKLGIVLNTKYEGKQRAEGWFDEELTKTRAPVVFKALTKKKMMELSTGLIVDVEGGEGTFNGKKYIGEARNHRPDHLAMLPDKEGACSIKDGAGLFQLNETTLKVILNRDESLKNGLFGLVLRSKDVQEAITNELSHAAIHTALREELVGDSKEPISTFIEDVYNDYFIYWRDGELKKQKYEASDAGVSFVDSSEVVERIVSYRPIENSKGTGENDMAKKEIVDGLIANAATQYDEKDRDWLMSLNEDQLKKMAPKPPENPKPGEGATPPAANAQATPPANQTATQGGTPAPAVNQQKTPEQEMAEYISKAPAAIQHILNNGVAVFNQEREKHVATILASPGNKLSKEILERLDINVLFNMAQMVQGAQAQNQQTQLPAPTYLGLAPTMNQATGGKEHKEAPLEIPTLNFDSNSKENKKVA